MSFSISQSSFIRNFISLFVLFYTLQLVPTSVTTLLYVHLVFSLLLLHSPKPQYKLAMIHYLSGFAILIFYNHTNIQMSVNIILSVLPYGYYEIFLEHV